MEALPLYLSEISQLGFFFWRGAKTNLASFLTTLGQIWLGQTVLLQVTHVGLKKKILKLPNPEGQMLHLRAYLEEEKKVNMNGWKSPSHISEWAAGVPTGPPWRFVLTALPSPIWRKVVASASISSITGVPDTVPSHAACSPCRIGVDKNTDALLICSQMLCTESSHNIVNPDRSLLTGSWLQVVDQS